MGLKKGLRKESIQSLLKLVKPYWHFIFISIIFSILASFFSGAIAWLVKPLFDKIFLPKNYKYFAYLPFVITGIFFLRASAVFLQAYFVQKASYSLGKDLRIAIFKKIVNLPLVYTVQKGSGELISRVINDVFLIENTFVGISKVVILESFTILVLIGVALYRSWKLTFFTFTVFPAVFLVAQWLAKKAHKNRHKIQKEFAILTEVLSDTIAGLKEIKIYLQEEKITQVFKRICERAYKGFLKSVKYEEGSKFGVNVLSGIAAGIIVFYGGYLIKTNQISPGDFFSLFTAILMIFTPLKKLAGAYNKLSNAVAVVERIEEVLVLPEEKKEGKKINIIKEGFHLKNVSFRYPGAEDFALKSINLFIPAGKVTAIIGKSGSGKSTLVSLIPRFYDPTEGVITLDGIDLREIDLTSLRKLIGIVSQEVVVFNMSIAENIALGNPDATMEDIIRAAKLAYAHDFIMELPNGYDTILGKEGFSLSGGQKQRIAIARAFLKNPPVLILDEATSQLDTVSEMYIQKALSKLMKDKTTIIIAHRLSTVKNADFVVVLKEGKVVCTGAHKELEDRCQEYQNLYGLLK